MPTKQTTNKSLIQQEAEKEGTQPASTLPLTPIGTDTTK
jgi:hypothetical protein